MSWKQFDVNMLNHYFSWFIVKENDDKNSNVDATMSCSKQTQRCKSKSHQNLTDSQIFHRAETRPVTHPAVFVYVYKKRRISTNNLSSHSFQKRLWLKFFQIPRLQFLQEGTWVYTVNLSSLKLCRFLIKGQFTGSQWSFLYTIRKVGHNGPTVN